ncbi:MAG: hypothetical protein ABFE07_29415 [Armatimonadia bacterium]
MRTQQRPAKSRRGSSKQPRKPASRIQRKKTSRKSRSLKCIVAGCENIRIARGYCSVHYHQIRVHGKIKESPEKSKAKSCVVVGCSKKICAHHLCSDHYQFYLSKHIHSGRTWEEVDRIIAESNQNSLANRDRLAIIKARHEIIKNAREAYFKKQAALDDLLDGAEFPDDKEGLELDPDDLEVGGDDDGVVPDEGGADALDKVR